MSTRVFPRLMTRAELEATETRECRNCSQVKPLTEFYRKLTGHQYRCKECNAEVVRSYSRAARHPWGQASRKGDPV